MKEGECQSTCACPVVLGIYSGSRLYDYRNVFNNIKSI